MPNSDKLQQSTNAVHFVLNSGFSFACQLNLNIPHLQLQWESATKGAWFEWTKRCQESSLSKWFLGTRQKEVQKDGPTECGSSTKVILTVNRGNSSMYLHFSTKKQDIWHCKNFRVHSQNIILCWRWFLKCYNKRSEITLIARWSGTNFLHHSSVAIL